MIEPTGRMGSDDGIDIRAEEVSAPAFTLGEDDDDAEEGVADDVREWRIQCKRYKRLHPKAVSTIVDELVPDPKRSPYGILIAAAADVSAEALAAFHARALALGVAEHHFWSRSVIEDLLYRPENDHLLFAYFGISIQARRRSVAATIRAGVALKKQLRMLFEKDEDGPDRFVLLRDPNDERYPRRAKDGEPRERWLLVQHYTLKNPGRLVVLAHEHPAWLTPDRRGWDALFSDDLVQSSAEAHLESLQAWGAGDSNGRDRHRPNHDYWAEYVPEQDKAWLKIARPIDLQRVIAIDPLGDGYFPIPHLFVDFREDHGPFEPGVAFRWFESSKYPAPRTHIELRPDDGNRARLFPDPLPLSVFPAPPELDDGKYPATGPLSAEAAPKLAALLEQVATRRKAIAERHEAARGQVEPGDQDDGQAHFRSWRDSVALPTLSASAERLRAAGERARVVVRSSPGSGDTEASESVELRFSLLVGTNFNPEYRAAGYLRAAWSRYTGLTFEVSPKPESPARSYGPTPPTPRLALEGLSQQRIEQELLAALERILAERQM